mgnify:CR=1 FL=1
MQVISHKTFHNMLVGAGFREPRRRALQLVLRSEEASLLRRVAKPAPILLVTLQNHFGELLVIIQPCSQLQKEDISIALWYSKRAS